MWLEKCGLAIWLIQAVGCGYMYKRKTPEQCSSTCMKFNGVQINTDDFLFVAKP